MLLLLVLLVAVVLLILAVLVSVDQLVRKNLHRWLPTYVRQRLGGALRSRARKST